MEPRYDLPCRPRVALVQPNFTKTEFGGHATAVAGAFDAYGAMKAKVFAAVGKNIQAGATPDASARRPGRQQLAQDLRTDLRAPAMKFEDVPMVADACLCTNVQRAARAISRRYDEAFRPLGLTNWQFTLMVATFRPEPPTINALAEALGTDRTTITANLKQLEARGLVKVEPDARDKRVRRVSLTQAGNKLLQQAYPVWRGLQVGVEKDLAFEDLEGFRDNLRAVAGV